MAKFIKVTELMSGDVQFVNIEQIEMFDTRANRIYLKSGNGVVVKTEDAKKLIIYMQSNSI